MKDIEGLEVKECPFCKQYPKITKTEFNSQPSLYDFYHKCSVFSRKIPNLTIENLKKFLKIWNRE